MIFARSIEPYQLSIGLFPTGKLNQWRLYIGIIVGTALCLAIEGSYDLIAIGFAVLIAVSSLIFGVLSKFVPIGVF